MRKFESHRGAHEEGFDCIIFMNSNVFVCIFVQSEELQYASNREYEKVVYLLFVTGNFRI